MRGAGGIRGSHLAAVDTQMEDGGRLLGADKGQKQACQNHAALDDAKHDATVRQRQDAFARQRAEDGQEDNGQEPRQPHSEAVVPRRTASKSRANTVFREF